MVINMITIDELLYKAKELGASDLHITVGISPKCRVNGRLVDLGQDKLLPSDTDAIDIKQNKRVQTLFICSRTEQSKDKCNNHTKTN